MTNSHIKKLENILNNLKNIDEIIDNTYFIITDDKGIILYIYSNNDQFLEYDKSDLINKSLDIFMKNDIKHVDLLEKYIKNKNKKKNIINIQRNVEAKTKSGNIINIIITVDEFKVLDKTMFFGIIYI